MWGCARKRENVESVTFPPVTLSLPHPWMDGGGCTPFPFLIHPIDLVPMRVYLSL